VPEDVRILEQFTAQIEVCLLARGQFQVHLDLARVDALTGLFTRRYFEEVFASELARAERYGESFILALFDADGLKKVNDEYGHQAGDSLLVSMAEALRGAHRKSDILGRYGGDEYVAIFHGSDPQAMAKSLQAIRARLRAKPIESEGSPITVSFSFGLARFPEDGRSLADLIAVADRELYAMKRRRA